MNIKTLIPKDKFDFETVDKIKNYSFEEIDPASASVPLVNTSLSRPEKSLHIYT